MRRRALLVLVTAVVALAGCREHRVAIGFDPEVGDRYRFRSTVTTDVERTLGDETTTERDESVLEADERVVAVDTDGIRLDVTLERDGITARDYEVRFDRGDRLAAIDLVEGVPADALGLDLGTDLPADIASPPPGPLEPGTRWDIEHRVEVAGGGRPIVVTGTGHIDALGVVDGRDVAVVVVELRIPVRTVIDTVDGRVGIEGVQRTRSRTTYDLADGAASADETHVEGEVAVVVEPPADVVAPPVDGRIRYEVTTRTERVAADAP